MLFMTATFTPAPGKEAQLEALLRSLVRDTAGEPGAPEYMLHKTRQAPGAFMFYERFQDQAALDAHMDTPYMRAAVAAFPGLLASPPEVRTFELLAGYARPFQG